MVSHHIVEHLQKIAHLCLVGDDCSPGHSAEAFEHRLHPKSRSYRALLRSLGRVQGSLPQHQFLHREARQQADTSNYP